MKPLMPLFVMLIALFATSCIKFGEKDPLPNTMACEISGQLRIRDLDMPAIIDPNHRPTVMLMEQKYYTPWSPYREVLQKCVVDKNGYYRFEITLKKDVSYCLEVVDIDTSKYLNMVTPWLAYQKLQTVHYPLVGVSWAIPRFVNQTNLPGDSFQYGYGIGGSGWMSLMPGKIDTVMPWIHKTWGGSQIGSMDHYIKARLIRNGIERDTKIYYFVPPCDTSVITIRY
jgi:hypothetical protein